jgi:flagellar motor switch protein FliG
METKRRKKNMSKVFHFNFAGMDRILFGLFMLVPFAGLAQEDGIQTAEAIQSKKVSHYYEVLVRDELSKYYDERTFLVDATAFLKKPKAETPSIINSNTVTALPGLPVLPDELRSGLPPSYKEGEAQSLSIKNINMEIFVDTSYNDKDMAFISKMVSMAANLNEFRGDKLKVRKGVFPFKKRTVADAKLDEIKAGAQSSPESTVKVVEADSNPFRPYVENLASLIPLLIICLFLLLIVWITIRAFLNKKMNTEDAYTSILQELNQLKASLPQGNTSTVSSGETGPGELGDLRSFFLNSFIGNTQLSTQTLKNWIQEDKAEGLADAALLVKAVDEKLMNILSSELDNSLAKELKIHIKSVENFTPEEALTVLKKFKSDFQNNSLSLIDQSENRDMFGFLKQLSEQQLLHLIKEESEGIIGIVLAQLKADKSSQLLQKMDKAKRTKILAAMGKIDNIPLKLYRELAEKLSAKALDVVKMRYVAADGVESVLEVLESLPLSVQDEYLKSLAETDIRLAEKIRTVFITFSEIAGLPDKFLSGVVRNLDQDTLVRTLVQAEEGLQNKIIGLLPERMQLMIQSGMESMSDITTDEVEAAQKKFLQEIRREIKQLGGIPA